MTALTQGSNTTLFVSNALNGGAAKGVHTINNSTVVRLGLQSGVGQAPKVLSHQVIANGIPWRDDPAALVIGPTGVALASNGTLYLADTLDNRITAIPNALTRTTPAAGGGTTVTEGGFLKQPLGMVLAPNGNILTTNAGDGNIVETTPAASSCSSAPRTRRPARDRSSDSSSLRRVTGSTTSTTGTTRFGCCTRQTRGHPGTRGGSMKLSARNQLPAVVVAIRRGEAIANVELEVAGHRLVSSITVEAVDDLRLAEGSRVTAVIKASDVLIGVDDGT